MKSTVNGSLSAARALSGYSHLVLRIAVVVTGHVNLNLSPLFAVTVVVAI